MIKRVLQLLGLVQVPPFIVIEHDVQFATEDKTPRVYVKTVYRVIHRETRQVLREKSTYDLAKDVADYLNVSWLTLGR